MEKVAYCVNCGAKLPDDGGRFCPKCGKSFSEEPRKEEEDVNKGQRDFPLSAIIVAPGILMAMWMVCFASGGFVNFANGANGLIGNYDNHLLSFLMALLIAGALFDVGLVFSCLISCLGICFARVELSTGAKLDELTKAFPFEGLLKWGAWAYFLILIFGRFGFRGHYFAVSGLCETYLPEFFSETSNGFMCESVLVWVSAILVLAVAEGLFETCSRLYRR